MKKGKDRADGPKMEKRAKRSLSEDIETTRGERATSPQPSPSAEEAEGPKVKKKARSLSEDIETTRGEGATSPQPTPSAEGGPSVAAEQAAHVLRSYPEAGRCYVTDDGTCFLEGERGSARRYAESTGQGLWVYEGGTLKKAE